VLVKSKTTFTPLSAELDFWKMFFISREISFLPKRRRTALAKARGGASCKMETPSGTLAGSILRLTRYRTSWLKSKQPPRGQG
jgi:hypothetical protein